MLAIVAVMSLLQRDSPTPMRDVAVVCATVALLSLLGNIVFTPEMSGRWQEYSVVRKTMTKVLNAGALWAAMFAYVGWKTKRPVTAIIAAPLAAWATLLLHYGAGMLLTIYPADMIATNLIWFVAGFLLGPPLGLVGWLARRPDLVGLLFRLVVPIGAIVQPFYLHSFEQDLTMQPRAEPWSDLMSGVIVLLAGLGATVWVVATHRHRTRQRPAAEAGGAVET